jgi:hypothetical protein
VKCIENQGATERFNGFKVCDRNSGRVTPNLKTASAERVYA